MVRSIHVSWKELPLNKDPQQILKYFLPEFMTSQVDIDTENEGHVAYKCALRSYKKDVLSKSSSVLVTITGRRMEGAWKIANYSVLAFSYKDVNQINSSDEI